jgi:hypothetical protein
LLGVDVDANQPFFFPVEPAGCLTPSMGGSIAAEIIERHSSAHPAATERPTGSVADLLDPSRHSETPPDVLEHLRHERYPLEGSVRIKRRENLSGRAHFDKISRPKLTTVSPDTHLLTPTASCVEAAAESRLSRRLDLCSLVR